MCLLYEELRANSPSFIDNRLIASCEINTERKVYANQGTIAGLQIGHVKIKGWGTGRKAAREAQLV
jgi:hypothetical protein